MRKKEGKSFTQKERALFSRFLNLPVKGKKDRRTFSGKCLACERAKLLKGDPVAYIHASIKEHGFLKNELAARSQIDRHRFYDVLRGDMPLRAEDALHLERGSGGHIRAKIIGSLLHQRASWWQRNKHLYENTKPAPVLVRPKKYGFVASRRLRMKWRRKMQRIHARDRKKRGHGPPRAYLAKPKLIWKVDAPTSTIADDILHRLDLYGKPDTSTS